MISVIPAFGQAIFALHKRRARRILGMSLANPPPLPVRKKQRTETQMQAEGEADGEADDSSDATLYLSDQFMDTQRPYIIWRIKVLKLQEAVEKKVLKINGGPKDDGGSGQNDQAGGSGPKDLEGSSPSSVEARLHVGRVDDNLFSIETFGTMASVYVDDPNWAPENKSLLTFFTPQCQTLEAKMARAMMVSVFGKLGD